MRGPNIHLDRRYHRWSLALTQRPGDGPSAPQPQSGTVGCQRTAVRLWAALMGIEDGR